MIAHKIGNDIPDSMCEVCPQNYEDECRAFQVPHSIEEALHREEGGAKCIIDRICKENKARIKASIEACKQFKI